TRTPTPCTITFSDVHPSDYFYTAVMYLACHGVVSGYSDGTFRPYNYATRGQTSKIVVLAVGLPANCPRTGHSSAVPPTNPFFCYIATGSNAGILCGYGDGTFRPYNDVTRGQLCKIVVIAMGWPDDCPTPGHFSDVPPGSPFYCYIETAYNHGVINGYADGTFRPGNDATRGQIAVMIYQALTHLQTPTATNTPGAPTATRTNTPVAGTPTRTPTPGLNGVQITNFTFTPQHLTITLGST